MARISKNQRAIFLLETERMMLRVGTGPATTTRLSKQFGVTEAIVQKYYREVRVRWREQLERESEEELGGIRQIRRDTMRKQLVDIIAQANARSKTVREDVEKDGKIVSVKKRIPNPDLNVVLRATKQLRELDALDVPKTAQILVSEGAPGGQPIMSPAQTAYYFKTGTHGNKKQIADFEEAWEAEKATKKKK